MRLSSLVASVETFITSPQLRAGAQATVAAIIAAPIGAVACGKAAYSKTYENVLLHSTDEEIAKLHRGAVLAKNAKWTELFADEIERRRNAPIESTAVAV